mgnify:CR=1 FL=1
MTDRCILVTGASRGIGRAIALRLARDGFDIAVHCRSRRELAEAVAAEIEALGRKARVLEFDVADRAACAAAIDADIEAHGAYHGVVCNAGIARDNAFPAMPAAATQHGIGAGSVVVGSTRIDYAIEAATITHNSAVPRSGCLRMSSAGSSSKRCQLTA